MNDRKNDLTEGSVGRNLVLFALPYLLSSFMQTFYGMADLFVVGLYNGSETTTAVSIGGGGDVCYLFLCIRSCYYSRTSFVHATDS